MNLFYYKGNDVNLISMGVDLLKYRKFKLNLEHYSSPTKEESPVEVIELTAENNVIIEEEQVLVEAVDGFNNYANI